jgi:hypothetical protein
MLKHPKVWKRVGALALASTASVALLAGCQKQEAAAPAAPAASEATSATPAASAPAAGSMQMAARAAPAGEGGEGEGGAAKPADIRTDNVAYLEQLSYVKGHLLAGTELYKAGAADMGMVHMKHPQDELIAGLKPGIEARNAPNFDAEITTLSDALHGAKPAAEVEADYNAFVTAIDKTEAAGTANTLNDPKQVITLVEHIVRTAASEYALGVQNGKVVNPKEYQDAYGFVQIAKQRVAAVTGAAGPAADALAKVKEQLDALAPCWPSIVPPATVNAEATMLYGAAARIEIAGLSI